MNYFLKELLNNKKRFWIILVVMGVWAAAIVDAFTSAIRPPGLFGGKLMTAIFYATFIGFFILIIYKITKNYVKKKKSMTYNMEADEYEYKRKKEFRRIFEQHPEFNTLCFECRHFDKNVNHCSRDLNNQKVKEFEVGNKKYCLYWEEEIVETDI